MKALAIACALLFVGANVAQAQFTGSAHDFSDNVTHYTPSSGTYDTGEGTWNVGGEDMCTVCHNAHTPGIGQPLWFHKLATTATYTVYSNSTMDATPGQPTGNSKLCLSCHDGTVGIDQYGWGGVYAPADPTYTVPHPMGDDLSTDHPIAFTYDAALAAADGFLFDPTATNVTLTDFNARAVTGTITDLLLDDGGSMECSSCHDVHNKYNLPHSLNVPKTGDAICVTCHAKG